MAGCAGDDAFVAEKLEPVEAAEACAVQAEAWCQEAVTCDQDTLVRGPADYDRCVAGVTDLCLEGRSADVDGDELDACLEAIAGQGCSPVVALPDLCQALWSDPA